MSPDFKSAIASSHGSFSLRRVVLGVVLLGLVVLVVPGDDFMGSVAAENPTATNVFAGDAVASATVGTGTRLFAFRLANDDTTASHRAGWEVNPGASVTAYFRTWTTGISPPAAPNGNGDDVCAIRLFQDNTATNMRTIHAATTCPSVGASFDVYCTHNGLVTGNPIAGTLRFVVAVEDRTAGIPVYSVDSDSGTGHAQGAIRCGLNATGITHSGYPTGSTYAYTVAGESFTVELASTPRAGGQSAALLQFRLHDAGGQIATTGNILLDSDGTTTSTAFTVTDALPAATTSATVRIVITGNSALTGVKFTHVSSATPPLASPDDATIERGDALTVDPRITATHLLQVNDASLGSPPMSKDAGTTRYNDDIGRIATRFTNARGEGLAGGSFAFTSSLQDDGLVLAADTGTGLTISTQGGEAGWSTLRLWNNGAPLGSYTKTVDVTAPATIDANTHLVNAVLAYELDVDAAGGETIYTGADPLTIFAHQPQNGTIPVAVHSRLLNGAARIGAADTIFVSAFDWPAMTPVVTAQAVVEVSATAAPGGYAYAFPYPHEGTFLLAANTTDGATAIGAFTVITVSNATVADLASNLQSHRDHSLELTMNSDFYGMGFDGFLFFVFWFVLLLLFVFKWELEWCAAFTVPAILIFVVPVPEIGGYDWDMTFSVICIIFGVLMQFLQEKKNAKDKPSVTQ